MNPPNQLTIAPTPRTDAAYFATGATMYSLAGEMKLIERELTAAQAVVKAFPDSGDDSLYNVRRLRAELAAAKAECERLTANQRQPAEDIFVSHLCDELTRLRAEVERWQTVAAEMSLEREHNANEASRLRAEVEAFKNNNRYHRGHSAGYAEAKDDCDAELLRMANRAEKAEAALADWSVLKGWGGTPEIIHEFIKGQQTRIHHCQDLEAELITERARLDYLDLQMGMPQVSEALNLPFSQCFPIRDAIDRAMKNETNTP
jgi:chromosome segregation ATPase